MESAFAMPRPYDAIIFDMDGTLTRPSLDFAAIRREIGLPTGDLTVEIPKLPPVRRAAAWAVVEAHEEQAMRSQELQPGCRELLAECQSAGLRVGVVTRNARRSIDHLCARFGLRFDAAVSREFPFVKPHPGPILHMLAQWSVEPARALTVGDYVHDIDCGRAAGTRTCFFQNPGTPFHGRHADFVVASMAELRRVLFPNGRGAGERP